MCEGEGSCVKKEFMALMTLEAESAGEMSESGMLRRSTVPMERMNFLTPRLINNVKFSLLMS